MGMNIVEMQANLLQKEEEHDNVGEERKTDRVNTA